MALLQHVSAALDSAGLGLGRGLGLGVANAGQGTTLPPGDEMEGLIAAFHQELEYVRQEKVWNSFKLQEADNALTMLEEKYPQCFSAVILLHKVEIRLKHWVLSPTYALLKEVLVLCTAALKKSSASLKECALYPNNEAILVFALELRITRCELQLVVAFTDFQKRNVMAGAHTLLGIYNQYNKLAEQVKRCEEKVFLKDQLARYCDHSLSVSSNLLSLDRVDPSLLQSLSQRIDLKTREIRQMHRDRHMVVEESVLAATRDLLQMKQLYKDLVGRWRSSDGHNECTTSPDQAPTPSVTAAEPIAPFVLVTPEKKKPPKPQPLEVEGDAGDDFDKENDLQSFMSPPPPQPRGSPGVELSPMHFKAQRPVAQISKMFPLPSFSDLGDLMGRMFDPTPGLELALKPRTGRATTTAATAPKPKVAGPMSTVDARNASFCDYTEMEECVRHAGDSVLPKVVLRLKGRLLLGSALFSLGLCVVPESLGWVLAILNLKPDAAMGLMGLYTLHKLEHGTWSSLATLLLLNAPQGLVEKCFDEARPGSLPCAGPSHLMALVQAQALLLPWTATHPLYLLSAVVQQQSCGTSLPTHIDHLRRAMRAEKGLLHLGTAAHCTSYWIRVHIARRFLSVGHWMQAVSTSRELLGLFSHDAALRSSAALHMLGGAAALLVSDLFLHQTTYLQLKFDERILYNESKMQLPTSAKHQHLVQVLTKAFGAITGGPAGGDQDTLHAQLFLGDEMADRRGTFAQRMRMYLQAHRLLQHMQEEAFDVLATPDSVMEDFLVHWCFLLPLEATYLLPHGREDASLASHAVLLQVGDKGALMFAEKHLLAGGRTVYKDWGELVRAVVVRDLVNLDPALLRQTLALPRSKLMLQHEVVVLTGSRQLRLVLDEVTPLVAAASGRRQSVDSSALLFGPEPSSAATSAAAADAALRRMRARCARLVRALPQKLALQVSGFKLPKRPQQLAGDQVVTWLVLRGLALRQMHRVWEAALMFKLLLSLQGSAPRTRWASFVALFHLADLVLSFDVCESPQAVAAEYLDQAAAAMEEALCSPAGATLYVEDYLRRLQELAAALQLQLQAR